MYDEENTVGDLYDNYNDQQLKLLFSVYMYGFLAGAHTDQYDHEACDEAEQSARDWFRQALDIEFEVEH